MQQSPSSEANDHSASQEISRILWKVRKSPPLVHILNQINPTHPYFSTYLLTYLLTY